MLDQLVLVKCKLSTAMTQESLVGLLLPAIHEQDLVQNMSHESILPMDLVKAGNWRLNCSGLSL